MKPTIIVFLLLLAARPGSGAEISAYGRSGADLSQYVHQSWKRTDGLPQDSVAAVLQTRDGYLWLGTQEGLVRFDGVTFTLYNKGNTPAFTHNDVLALAEGPDGSLWIGTFGGLLQMVDGQFVAHPTRLSRERDAITSVAVGSDGAVWVGTQSAGVNRFHGGRYEFFGLDAGLPSLAVEGFEVLPSGDVAAATRAGLAVYRGGRWGMLVEARSLPSPDVRAVRRARDGSLWVGTARGVARIRDGAVDALPVPALANAVVTAIFEDRSGAVLLGTGSGAVWHVAAGQAGSRVLERGFSENPVEAICQDREGSVWVGTYVTGLHRLWRGRFSSLTSDQGLPGLSLRAIAQTSEGDVWLSTESDGVSRFDGRRVVTYTTRDGLPSDVARSLLQDSRGTLWVGTREGLARFERDRFHAVAGTRGMTVRALAEDASGTVWLGTRDQTYRLVEERLVAVGEDGRTPLPRGTIRMMHRSRDGAMWVGTNESLTRWHGSAPRVFTREDGLPPDAIYCVHEDPDGTMWFGSYGGGLVRWRDGRFTRFTQADGLFDDVAYQILDDDRGFLWVSCNNGVYRVSKAELEAFAAGRTTRITSDGFGAADGLLSGECNGNAQPAGWRAADGRMWFPTTQGAAIIDPESLMRNELAPLVALGEVAAGGRRYPVSAEARLEPGAGTIGFSYAAMSFIAPRKVRYRYRLEGLETDWVEAGDRRQTTYSNLAPGRYVFHVTACNNDGVWSEAGARFAFTLLPRFYQTVWFQGCMALAVIGLLFAGYRVRVWQHVRRERELTARVEQAMSRIKVLGGLIPICASCKNIRDDRGYWNQLEQYLRSHSEATFSHGICPECVQKLYPEDADTAEPPDEETASPCATSAG